MWLKTHDFDLAHFYSAPGLAWIKDGQNSVRSTDRYRYMFIIKKELVEFLCFDTYCLIKDT